MTTLFEKTEKTRILSPGRSAGDGMENIHFNEINQNQSLVQNSFSPITFIPKTGKSKEPKFVPYEPYKAAVSPIVPHRIERIHDAKDVIDSQRVSSLASSIIKLQEKSKNTAPITLQTFPLPPPQCKTCPVKDEEIKNLKEKIDDLEKEKRELSAQYEAQIEVTADLKKLLVAALGEDVEIRVGQLVEQKAKLGAKLIELHSQLADNEQIIENLQVETSLWESKFQASSVLVQEISLWKKSLGNRLGALGSLLTDYDELFHELCLAHSILNNTLSAFDREPVSNGTLPPMNVLQLASSVGSLSNVIQSRLLGKGKRSKDIDIKYSRLLTPAEDVANEIIQHFNLKVYQCGQTKCDSGRVACELLPHVCEADATLHFCKHCSGEIKTI